MAITDFINKGISKGTDIVGTANALKSFLPEPLQKALGSFLNGPASAPNAHRNLNEFKSNLNRFGGVARTNMFDVRINIPTMLSAAGEGAGGLSSRDISLLCEGATLPGISLNTTPIKRYGYGQVEKKPYLTTYTDQTFTFIGDNSGAVHGLFYKWMNGIVKGDEKTSNLTVSGYNGLSPYEVEYKENYAVDIVITCYDDTDQSIIICTLYEAFPIFLGDIQLNWADTDQLMRVPVTFTFTHWKLDTVNINQALSNPAQNLSGLQKLLKVGSAVQTLASLRKPTGVADIINVVDNSKKAIGGLGGLF